MMSIIINKRIPVLEGQGYPSSFIQIQIQNIEDEGVTIIKR
jgi:hypothetical protein